MLRDSETGGRLMGVEGGEPEITRLDRVIDAARDHLLSLQEADGHWCAELEGDNILESEYVMLFHFLGRAEDPRVAKLCNYLRQCQNEDGGWSIYPDGPTDPNPSVKSYFALKLQGDSADAPHMIRARKAIEAAGGIEACNSFTKLYLAVFDQYSWRDAPVVPPELILAPDWLPVNIWEMSSWSRAIVVPLAIVWSQRPLCEVPRGRGIQELARGKTRLSGYMKRKLTIWQHAWALFFRALNEIVHVAETLSVFRPVRKMSIERCQAWIEPRLENSAGLAAIFPSILNVVMAYKALGYDDDHPAVSSQLAELEKLEIEEGDTIRVQPCQSPVWDTALTLASLLDSGVENDDPSITSAIEWLLDHEVRAPGDWQVKNPKGPVGGWYFEYANEFYPDCDDTAEILAFFSHHRSADPDLEKRKADAVARAIAWQLSMQNRDGGWAAFDRECNRQLLTLIPFADHNAMIDPSTADVTARTIEALCALGMDEADRPIRRGLDFLLREQEKDGSWYGRWGANYIYGTWLTLQALAAVGRGALDRRVSKAVLRGVEWLLSCQNADGGWGESLLSYDDPSCRGRGETTASQTAWAMMGLMAARDLLARENGTGERLDEALRRGASSLQRTQQHDGSWVDEHWTGTGFPSVFYLRYHSYARYFPLQALAIYRRSLVSTAATAHRVA